MYSILFLAAVSFLLSFLLTPLVRNVFTAWGIVDHPDERRTHQHPIPRVGGVAIALSYALAFGLLFVVKLQAGRIIWNDSAAVIRLLPAAGLIFLVGLLDDLVGLTPWQKLSGQIVAALLAFWGGVHLQGFAGHTVAPWLSIPLTIAWLVICTNALNLIDGMDGLAAGVGLFATSTIVIAALVQNNVTLALATVPLAACLLGFLRYNFNPATIFLGDSGSLFIGFLLGCFGVLWSQKAATMLGMTAPLMALAVPLLDTALAIVRRFLSHKPIFGADRGHIHHRLLDHGLTPRKAALVLYACCALGAVASLLAMNRNFSGFVIIIFCIVTWIGIQHLGYVEFGIAGRMFIEGAFRRQLKSQISLHGFEEELLAAASPDECWNTIKAASAEFGFRDVEMLLCGSMFQEPSGVAPDRCWNIRIPLAGNGYIELSRELGTDMPGGAIGPFVDIIHRTIDAKLPEFQAARVIPPPAKRAAHAG
jgi:UDP-GlcNAc:undecaprenyl-phosphate GlcNAc-1-phosphate transferase